MPYSHFHLLAAHFLHYLYGKGKVTPVTEVDGVVDTDGDVLIEVDTNEDHTSAELLRIKLGTVTIHCWTRYIGRFINLEGVLYIRAVCIILTASRY